MFKKWQKLLPAKEETQGKEDIQVGRVAEEEESYDELLLAVIGILDGLKYEGNVAGWMRSGGLIHVGDQQAILGSNHSPRTPDPSSENAEVTTPTTATTTLSPRTKRDGSPMPIPGLSTKRRRIRKWYTYYLLPRKDISTFLISTFVPQPKLNKYQ